MGLLMKLSFAELHKRPLHLRTTSTDDIHIISIGQVRHIYVMMKSTFKQLGQRLTFLLLTSKKKLRKKSWATTIILS